jgi:hypothetical protein
MLLFGQTVSRLDPLLGESAGVARRDADLLLAEDIHRPRGEFGGAAFVGSGGSGGPSHWRRHKTSPTCSVRSSGRRRSWRRSPEDKHTRVDVGASDWKEVTSFVTGNEREALAGWGSASPTATQTSAASSVQVVGRDIRCGSNTSFRG